MTAPMLPQSDDEARRQRAKAEADRRIASGEFTTQEQVDQFMSAQGIAPRSEPAPLSTGEKLVGGARALVGQGFGLGWGDEVEAGLRAPFSDRNYKEIRDEIRGEQARFASEYPKTNLALEIGGGALPAVGSLIASGGASAPALAPALGARMARGAAVGMGTGAVSGAGMAPELEDVPRGAGVGATIGAVGGAALPAIFTGARNMAGRAADVLEAPIRALAASAPESPAIGAGGQRLLGPGAGAPGVGPTRAAARALQAVQNAPARAAQAVVPMLDRRQLSRAEQKYLQALIDDGMTPDAAAERLAQMQARGAPASLADVGEESMLELTNTPYLIPGPGRRTVSQFFGDRTQGTSGRLAEAVEKSSATKLGNVNQMAREMDAVRKPIANRMYRQAYAHGPLELDEQALDKIMTKDFRRGWYEGRRLSRLEAFTDEDRQPLAPLFKVSRDEAGDEVVELMRPLTVRDIQLMKLGIDEAASRARRMGSKNEERVLTAAKNFVLEQVDAQVPVYREARQFWGGVQGLMNALEDGKLFLRGGADDFADRVATLTPDELKFYRMGAANAIAEALRKREGRAVALNILTDPTAQQRLQAIYPDEEAFQTLLSVVGDEKQMAGPLARMSRQSQTAQNLLNVLDFASDMRPGQFIPEPKMMGMQALANLFNAGQRQAQSSSAAQLAELLTRQGPEAVQYLRSLQPQAQRQSARAAAGARAAGRTSGIMGGQVGRRTP